ncbi:MAG: hypothetical protein M1830_009917 [Pleopsidium flavum]|nr:MAG: hypothetical protein M1830_009917 [Pleopsidium flavum]
MASPVISQHFPIEILLLIFRQLRKQDLKSIRIVCKLWSSLAVEVLFDRVYISPQRKNVEVDKTRPEYFDDLCKQARASSSHLPTKHVFQSADYQVKEILRFAREGAKAPETAAQCVARLSKHRIIDRGHRIYLERAKQQQEYYEGGELLGHMCLGFEKLRNLETVVFEHEWSHFSTDRPLDPFTLHPIHRQGSLLARTWNPVFLEPTSLRSNKDAHVEFSTIIRALSMTQRKVKTFDSYMSLKLVQSAFDSKTFMPSSLLRHTINALQSVQTLSMRICSQGEHETGSIDALPSALRFMPALNHLHLDVDKGSDYNMDDKDATMYTLREVLGLYSWPHLSFLKLSAMITGELELVHCLGHQQKIRELHLKNFELTDGQWANVLDAMRRSPRLKTLVLKMPLRHCGGVDVWDEMAWEDDRMDEKVERYVLSGGEKPFRTKPQW